MGISKYGDVGKNVKLISAFAIMQSPLQSMNRPLSLFFGSVFVPKFTEGICSVATVAFLISVSRFRGYPSMNSCFYLLAVLFSFSHFSPLYHSYTFTVLVRGMWWKYGSRANILTPFSPRGSCMLAFNLINLPKSCLSF